MEHAASGLLNCFLSWPNERFCCVEWGNGVGEGTAYDDVDAWT